MENIDVSKDTMINHNRKVNYSFTPLRERHELAVEELRTLRSMDESTIIDSSSPLVFNSIRIYSMHDELNVQSNRPYIFHLILRRAGKGVVYSLHKCNEEMPNLC